jgi:hypothetical protein
MVTENIDHLFLDGRIPAEIPYAQQHRNCNARKPSLRGLVDDRTLHIVIQRGNNFHATEQPNQQPLAFKVREIDEERETKLDLRQELHVPGDVEVSDVPAQDEGPQYVGHQTQILHEHQRLPVDARLHEFDRKGRDEVHYTVVGEQQGQALSEETELRHDEMLVVAHDLPHRCLFQLLLLRILAGNLVL